MTSPIGTKDLEAALRWRGADLAVTVSALFPATLTQAQAQEALASAVKDALPAGFTSRVEQTSPQHPWFASIDATVATVDALSAALPGLLARLLSSGAAAAWAGFEGGVLEEQDVFSGELYAQHYAVACGPTLGTAFDDADRASGRWKSVVLECRMRLARLFPTLLSPS